MLDIKLIRDTPDIVNSNLKKRGDPANLKMLEDLIDWDKKWRQDLTKLNDLRHERRQITAEIAMAKKKGKDASSEIAKAKDVDTIILPMLGFDLKGNRLGYGAGYYDRFLAKNTHITAIGIAFACQEANMIPHRRKDIKLDFITTEEGLMFC